MLNYSVLMSVYEKVNPEYFRLAVKSMLDQSVVTDDFVIVCDGPLTEELDKAISDFTDEFDFITVIRLSENKKLGIALGEGLKHCKNEIVARMDADDIALPGRMKTQLEMLESNPDIAVAGGQLSEFCDDPSSVTGYRMVPEEDGDIRKFAVMRNPVNHVTVAFRKSAVEAAGSYIHFPYFEDYNLWIRMLAQGFRFKNSGEVFVSARFDDGSLGRRSGIAYYRQAKKLFKLMREKKLCGRLRCLKNRAAWFTGTVILPPGARKAVYKLFLRKKNKSEKNIHE